MEVKLVFAGVGGQGIQVASQLMCHAAALEGKRSLYITKFQGAQRGGLCECFVALADGRVTAAPAIMQPLQGALAMHPDSFRRFEALVLPGGGLIYNTSIRFGSNSDALGTGGRASMPIGMAMQADTELDLKPTRADIAYLGIPATEFALEHFGTSLPATLIAVGAFIEMLRPLPLASAISALPRVVPSHRAHLISTNERALQLGSQWVRDNASVPANPAPVSS